LRRGWSSGFAACDSGLRLCLPLAGFKLIDAVPQRTDQLVTFRCAALQRFNAPHQLFQRRFLVLRRRRLRESWAHQHRDERSAAKARNGSI
jgi:hypothetical protein